MARQLIPPRRDEAFSNQGLGTVRMLEYLEENAKQTNESTEMTESDPSSVNLSSAQLSQVNKKVAELVNESLISQSNLITRLSKRIEQLENTITVNQNNNKKAAQLENDFIAPFYKTRYDKLTIKSVFIDNATISEKIKLPLTNDASSPTIQFGDGDSGFYEESDDVIALSLIGTKRYNFSTSLFATPHGTWDGTGIKLSSGDSYQITGDSVLNRTTLGSSVLNSSLTGVGTLLNLNTSGVYSVDGTQVVGNREAAISDADGTLASATTKINEILSALRPIGHGLIG